MDKGKVGYLYYGHVGHAEAGQPLNCDFFFFPYRLAFLPQIAMKTRILCVY